MKSHDVARALHGLFRTSADAGLSALLSNYDRGARAGWAAHQRVGGDGEMPTHLFRTLPGR